MQEIWKDIVWYEGIYHISNLGRIKSFKQWKIVIRTNWITNSVYSSISLLKNKIIKSYLIHRLVAIHFIPNPDNLPCVLHRKEDLDENGLLYNWEDNLFWWTQKDNVIDMLKKWRQKNHLQYKHPSLWKFWKDSNKSKPVSQYSKSGEFIREWDSFMDVQRELWIFCSSICICCQWKAKSAWWFIWKYR